MLTGNGTSTTTENITVYVKDLDKLITAQLLVDSQLYSRKEKCLKNIGILSSGRNRITHIDQGWQLYSVRVGKIFVPVVVLGVIVDTSR